MVSAILLAAGKGTRFRSKISKPLTKIGILPIIVYSLKAFERHPAISEIIVVANKQNQRKVLSLIKQYRIKKVKKVVLGRKLRRDSVWCGLKNISQQADLVLIHDSARPFISERAISRVVREAARSRAAIVGVPVKNTIKRSAGKSLVKETLNRENLWEIQTPQVFKKDLILKAYKKFGQAHVTDDASLVEKLGAKVRIVMGSYFNLKITTPEDLLIAKSIAKNYVS